MLTKKQTTKIDTLRKEYFHAAIGKEQLLKLLSETEVFEQVYNSNAIENSTLSIEETEKILLQIDLDRYVSEREIYEAKNLARVTEYIDNNAKDKELSSDMMLFLHKILISNINNDIAGRFREGDAYVRVGNHIAPAQSQIAEDLEQTFMTYKADASKNIVERIARFHLDFETLHPFIDGNGRIGRSLNNYLLIREEYYKAFQEFNMSEKTDIMEQIIYGGFSELLLQTIGILERLEDSDSKCLC